MRIRPLNYTIGSNITRRAHDLSRALYADVCVSWGAEFQRNFGPISVLAYASLLLKKTQRIRLAIELALDESERVRIPWPDGVGFFEVKCKGSGTLEFFWRGVSADCDFNDFEKEVLDFAALCIAVLCQSAGYVVADMVDIVSPRETRDAIYDLVLSLDVSKYSVRKIGSQSGPPVGWILYPPDVK